MSREHGDGWGIAVHDAAAGWIVTKRAAQADGDRRFEVAVSSAVGSLLVAHVRSRTVGGISPDDTHPFAHGPWVFAHDGTVERVADLRATLDEGSLATVRGDTDSEVVFAFLLAKLASHPGTGRSRFVADMVLARAVEDLCDMPSLGAATFLLSDGVALYAFCHGRPLFLLERQVDSRTEAILVASEPVTPDEPWEAISDGALVVVWRRPRLGWAVMRQRSPVSARRPP